MSRMHVYVIGQLSDRTRWWMRMGNISGTATKRCSVDHVWEAALGVAHSRLRRDRAGVQSATGALQEQHAASNENRIELHELG